MTQTKQHLPLPERVEAAIVAEGLITPESAVVVGFSGGPDSMFLLRMLADLREKMGLRIVAAHLDHGWRAESAKEADWCYQQVARLGVNFVTAHLDQVAADLKPNGSKEELARRARRRFLESVTQEHGATSIALAHHADDQQETFFIRLLRGASLSGLTCMKLRDGAYVRPLLGIRKAEILAYLEEHKIFYLADPTNESPAFLRNRVRQEVMPALRACDARFAQNFHATLIRLQEAERLLDELTRQKFATLSSQQDGKTAIATMLLSAEPRAMQYRLLLQWLCHERVSFVSSQSFFEELLRFLCSPRGGTHEVCDNWRVIKRSGLAWIERYA